jgi:hypothetical protein
MNIHVNEFHNIGIYDITSPFSDKFHEKWAWVCLDIINKIHEPFP